MTVIIKKGERYIIGKLTGRIINGKHEIKTKTGSYHYAEEYEKYKEE